MTLLLAGHDHHRHGAVLTLERLTRIRYWRWRWRPPAQPRMAGQLATSTWKRAVARETLRLRLVVLMSAELLRSPVEVAGYRLPAR